jgi:hypothetical protein
MSRASRDPSVAREHCQLGNRIELATVREVVAGCGIIPDSDGGRSRPLRASFDRRIGHVAGTRTVAACAGSAVRGSSPWRRTLTTSQNRRRRISVDGGFSVCGRGLVTPVSGHQRRGTLGGYLADACEVLVWPVPPVWIEALHASSVGVAFLSVRAPAALPDTLPLPRRWQGRDAVGGLRCPSADGRRRHAGTGIANDEASAVTRTSTR